MASGASITPPPAGRPAGSSLPAARAACRRAGAGLLVTAHRPVGLPDLRHTHVTPELAGRVVSALLAGRDWWPAGTDLAALLSARGGNLRDVLFDL